MRHIVLSVGRSPRGRNSGARPDRRPSPHPLRRDRRGQRLARRGGPRRRPRLRDRRSTPRRSRPARPTPSPRRSPPCRASTVVQSGSPGQQTSLFLRGAESEQTLLLWNGIPLNDPFFGGANWQFVPLDGVERVEVVRGPFSALYGSNAMGGVVQVFTGSAPGRHVTPRGRRERLLPRRRSPPAPMLGRLPLRRHRPPAARTERRAGERLLRQRGAGGPRRSGRSRPGVSLGLLVRANDSETGIPLVGGQPTPTGDIAWEEREVAVPFLADLGSWEVEAQLSQTRSSTPPSAIPTIRSASPTRTPSPRACAAGPWRPGGRDEDLWVAVGSEAERLEVTSGSNFGTNLDGSRPAHLGAVRPGELGPRPAAARPRRAPRRQRRLRRRDQPARRRGGRGWREAYAAAGELRRGLPRAVAGRAVLPLLRQPRPPARDRRELEVGIEQRARAAGASP